MHVWTNDKAIKFQIDQSGFNSDYYNNAKIQTNVLKQPEFDVFAFQEMKKSCGSCQNDKNIFNSITTLMKSQSYEMLSLESRKKNCAVYQFNLISIVDSEIIRLKFEDDQIIQNEIDEEVYISRYIIRHKEEFSRIHFAKAKSIENIIKEYDELHKYNLVAFERTRKEFYVDILKDQSKMKLLLDDFRKEIKRPINRSLKFKSEFTKMIDSIWLRWNEKKSILDIEFEIPEEQIQKMNVDENLKKRVTEILNALYRFTGKFEFSSSELPF